ncbi:hypothetical protein TSTA_110210 [Talaromyces stipitatus ATCC 10500]|uniref:Methyltransferase type 11 domain-containing protein n=1 Tax=Talaromyces stipitatus (strain ATCC 10500 / CBS 375.48 / QM 6759 / NRRL 1006) TaxID=441959 RepID=B8MUG9_TALSN|nr:uncharacterized protein TSTA_110210 [Talaromyces stipitatus ATCC 10500]EED11841.1 hypothetical protein TSTA_110210 [Talaromyces stipitatus ATCC 10500]
METFAHATEPETILAGFFRILRPSGRISLLEYNRELTENVPEVLVLPGSVTQLKSGVDLEAEDAQ